MKNTIIGFVIALVVGLIVFTFLPTTVAGMFDSILGSHLTNIILSAALGILFAVVASRKQFLSNQAALIGGALVSFLCVIFGLYMRVEIASAFNNVLAAVDSSQATEPIDKTALFVGNILSSIWVIILSTIAGGGAAMWIASRPKNLKNR